MPVRLTKSLMTMAARSSAFNDESEPRYFPTPVRIGETMAARRMMVSYIGWLYVQVSRRDGKSGLSES